MTSGESESRYRQCTIEVRSAASMIRYQFTEIYGQLPANLRFPMLNFTQEAKSEVQLSICTLSCNHVHGA
jgi:hypothetical protein